MADVFYYGNAPSTNNQNQNDLDSAYSPLVAFPPPSRQRRSRTMFTDEDVRMLEDFFTRDPYPDIYGREELAAAIGVPEARIQTWFQNKRSRTRRRLNNQGQRSPPITSSPSNITNNNTMGNINNNMKQESAVSPLQSPIPCMGSRSPVFQLQPPPSVHGTRTPTPEYRQRSSPPSRINPVKVTPVKVTPVKPNPVRITERDADDSGVLDLSIKSNDSPRDMSAKGTTLPSFISASPNRVDPGTGRPFFTPWAPAPTYTAAGSCLPPAVVTSAAKMAASDALAMAAASSQMTSGTAFPMASQNPWLYGFTPSYNHKNGAYYLQPMPTSPFLPASPFLHNIADVFPTSPGLTPLVGTPSSDWSVNYLSPSLRSAPKHFLFPALPVAASCAASPTRDGGLQTPPSTPLPAATTSTDEAGLTPATLDVAAPTSTEQGLSESPGSDAGSRSSGYSSRDSDIDVCN